MSDFIERHLTEEQRTEIAAEEWRAMCREYFSRDQSVAIGNVCYPMVKTMVAEILGDGADALIAEKAIEVINGLSAYTVFHAPQIYDKTPSPAWVLLQKVVQDQREDLGKIISRHIHNISKADALEIIKSGNLTISTGAA